MHLGLFSRRSGGLKVAELGSFFWPKAFGQTWTDGTLAFRSPAIGAHPLLFDSSLTSHPSLPSDLAWSLGSHYGELAVGDLQDGKGS